MIRLDATTRKLQIILGGAVTTNQLPVTVCYSDKSTAGYTGGTQLSNTNSGTAVDILNAPAAGAVRDLDYLSVRNSDTVAATTTIRYNDNATLYTIVSVVLQPSDTLAYTHASGWQVTNSSGSVKTVPSATIVGVTDDTTTNATMYPLWVTANSGSLPVKLSSTKLTWNPSTGVLGTPQLLIATTVGVGGATPSASGVGITFPATPSLSTNANTLDDYEEGTWTIGFAFGGGTTGITYGFNSGTYVKIGSAVTVNGLCVLTNKGSSTGALTITGFPFTFSGFVTFSMRLGGLAAAINAVPSIIGNSGTTNASVQMLVNTATSYVNVTDANASNTLEIAFGATFKG